jgi:hypothetical protein
MRIAANLVRCQPRCRGTSGFLTATTCSPTEAHRRRNIGVVSSKISRPTKVSNRAYTSRLALTLVVDGSSQANLSTGCGLESLGATKVLACWRLRPARRFRARRLLSRAPAARACGAAAVTRQLLRRGSQACFLVAAVDAAAPGKPTADAVLL